MSAGERLPGAPEPMHIWEGHNGVPIAGDTWGNPDGPLVVLQHGGGQTRHAWKGAGETLGAAGYHAVAFDARGHSDSGWAADGEYNADDMVEDLKCVVAALGGERPILVGASMGGGTSLVAVGEERLDAGALVLVDMAPRIEPEGSRKIQEFMNQRPEGFNSLEEVAEAIANYQPHRKRPRNLDGLAKNVRLAANGKYVWHWDPARRRGRATMGCRRQSDAADAAGARRSVRRAERGGGAKLSRPMSACRIRQRRQCGPYGRRRPQRHLRHLGDRIPAARGAAQRLAGPAAGYAVTAAASRRLAIMETRRR